MKKQNKIKMISNNFLFAYCHLKMRNGNLGLLVKFKR
jgi:hypothetical protein